MHTTHVGTPWRLGAPESFVLLNGPSANGAEAFKLGVLELVTRNVVKIVNVEERGMLGRRKTTAVLVNGVGGEPDSRPLRSILDLYRQQRPRTFKDGTTGVPVVELAQAASRHYKSIGKYVEQDVLPVLIDQGLYVREERRTLGIFRSTRYSSTPEGETARADLQSRIELANREFGGWVRGDAARAMAFAGLAGAGLLLMPALYPELQLLGERLRQARDFDSETTSGTAASSTPASLGPERERLPDEERELQPGEEPGADVGGLDFGSLDLGGLDVSGLSSLDFSAFDSIGDAFSAIDSGVDSGGGDSGGSDGGGGDGGGGGGGD